MKKLLFWIVLIVGTVALIGSCAKKDDSTAATAATGTGSGTTASGTISGIDNLKSLQELNLKSNKISKISGLEIISNLTKLNISNNQISKI